MARWSALTNGSDFGCPAHIGVCRANGCCTKLDHVVQGSHDDLNDCQVKLRSLFYEFMLMYIKDLSSKGVTRPLPVMLSDGQPLDLYELFLLVEDRGGYHVVSKKRLWPLVLQQLGMGLDFLASVKLVYYKYLNGFEGWSRETFGSKKLKTGFHGCYQQFVKSLPLELEKTFTELVSVGPNKKRKEDELVQLASNKVGNLIDVIFQKNQSSLSEPNKEDIIFEDVILNIHQNCRHNQINPHTTLDSNKQFDSRKRKRVSLSATLDWVRRVAKCPLHPSIGPLPELSKWRKYKGKELWVQALRAREALLLKRLVKSNREASCLRMQKMHLGMDDDDIQIHQTRVNVRCSERPPTVARFGLCSCCNSFPAAKCESADPFVEEAVLETAEDDPLTKQVSVGPLFQAEVPDWTGIVHESDSKWLGTLEWPLKCVEQKYAGETNFTGRGRENCGWPVECVAFRIAEERMKLKLELSSTFFRWGFHLMGEEVSLRWTPEEEKRFKDILRSDHLRNFWNNACRYFPNKTRRDVVSYYFNVYLIRRRRYQNRVTPMVVDSDNEESDFGKIDGAFGREAVKVLANGFVECPLNEQGTVLY